MRDSAFFRLSVYFALVLATFSLGVGQDAASAVKVTITDGKTLAEDALLPLDPTPHIKVDFSSAPYYALTLDGKSITFVPQGILEAARIDNQQVGLGFGRKIIQPQPLPAGAHGRKRLGTQQTWMQNGLQFTRVIEIVPSQVKGVVAAGQKRRLDAVRISYLVENKDKRDHVVEYRAWMDTMVNGNDGALFAAPTTAPGKILDGTILKDETLPDYLLVIEHPNLERPGMVATLTLKFAKLEGPHRVALTNNLGIAQGWDIVPQQAIGDSGLALFWPPKTLKPGDKREMVWAHGGGIASGPEAEGRVALTLGGSFAPGKLFTILATVDDPALGQTLTLELPPGMQRVEGKERQPVPPPGASGNSMILWKARVERLGDFELKVRSSTGVTHTKSISIQAG